MSGYKVASVEERGVKALEKMLNIKLMDHIRECGGDPFEYYIKLQYEESICKWYAELCKYIYPIFNREDTPLHFIPAPNEEHICTIGCTGPVNSRRFADYIYHAYDKCVKERRKQDDVSDN